MESLVPAPAPDSTWSTCDDCVTQPFPFSMAFQPIVNVPARRLYAYEALVRGPDGESARSVLDQVTDANRSAFDQACRRRAIELATREGIVASGAALSINFMPAAMYTPETCVQATLDAAQRCGLPLDRLIFELTEEERIGSYEQLRAIFACYRGHGFRAAIDDFGAGYAGLNLLAEYQPDLLKLDMSLLRGIDASPSRQAIVASVIELCRILGVIVLAEGVETEAELHTLLDLGVPLFQGFLLARPAFEALPSARM